MAKRAANLRAAHSSVENAPPLPDSEQLIRIEKSVRGDQFRDFYANSVKIGLSPWDLTLTLGQVAELPDGSNAVRDEAAIRFSPQYFRKLIHLMTDALAQWETLRATLESE